jgi:acyl-CoA thioesterase-1
MQNPSRWLLLFLFAWQCHLDTSAATKSATAPAVLLIGDAVARQDSGMVRELVRGDLAVDYLPLPAGPKSVLDEFKAEFAKRSHRYSLIYLALGPEIAREPAREDRPPFDPRQLRQLLEDLFRDPLPGNPKIIWATAVPVPDGLSGFPSGRLESYNEIVANLAYNRRALLLDLHDYVRIRRADLQRPGDFMLTATGVELVASVVASRIQEALGEGNQPDLPRVLVLGDSIVNQYSTFLREKLIGRANVRTGGTAYDPQPDWPAVIAREVTEREREMGRPFDLIQFNWGLHALKWAQGLEYSMRFKEGFVRCVPLERYGAELEKLVVELKKTGRRLVWATTTPANNGAQPDDAEGYNAIAGEIMHRHGITVNDLNAFVVNNRIPQTEPRNCHFPRESAERLGVEVATILFDLLAKKSPGAAPTRAPASSLDPPVRP